MSLTEFLLARIAEDEEAAETQRGMDKRRDRRPEDWARYIIDPVIGPFGGQTQLRNVSTGLYVAQLSDPAHVLAECEAKRRIVDWCRHVEVFPASRVADGVLRLLALPYADHPDYLPEWRP